MRPADEGDRVLSAAALSEVAPEPASPETRPPELTPSARFERQAEIGTGGMGRVFIAHDRRHDRQVAIKVALDERHRHLFERETRITARLEHPGVLPLYESGVDAEGLPYFAMPFVRGQSLEAWLRDTPDREARHGRLRAMLTVCETLAYAHAQGVVHHDIKPANIMLGPFGQTLIIDWGLAHADDLAGPDASLPAGGTPRYMSPQQASGAPPSPTDDVFSAGAMLHELLTGAPAFPKVRTRREAAQPRPLPTPPADMPRPLEAIVARALAMDPAERYPSAAPLADDLARYLAGLTVRAHRYSPLERLRLWLRRWRSAATVGAIASLALIAAIAVAFTRVNAERAAAESLLVDTLASAASTALRDERREDARRSASLSLRYAPSLEAQGVLLSLPAAEASLIARRLNGCFAADISTDGRFVLCRPRDSGQTVTLLKDGAVHQTVHVGKTRGLAFIDEGRAFVVALRDRYRAFDTASGAPLAEFPRPCAGQLTAGPLTAFATASGPDCAVTVTLDGTQAVDATACGEGSLLAFAATLDRRLVALACSDGRLHLGSPAAPSERVLDLHLPPPWLAVTTLAFVPGSDELLIGTQHGWAFRLDPRDPDRRAMLPLGARIDDIIVDPSGQRAAFVPHTGGPLLIDVAAWSPLSRFAEDITALALEASGRVHVAGDDLTALDFSDVPPRSVGLPHGVASIAISPDGATVAVGQAGWLTTVNSRTRRPFKHHGWQGGVTKAVDFDPAGALVAHGMSRPEALRFVDPTLSRPPAIEAIGVSRRVLALPDGALLTAGWTTNPSLWRGGRIIKELEIGAVADIARNRSGSHVALLTLDGDLFWGEDLLDDAHPVHMGRVSHGLSVVLRGDEGPAGLLALTHDAIENPVHLTERYEPPGGKLTSLAASTRHVIAGTGSGVLWFWRRGAPEPYAMNRAHDGRVTAIAVAPDGTWAVSGGWDGRVFFWDLAETPMR